MNPIAKDKPVLNNSSDNDFENIVEISPFPIMIHKMGTIRYVNNLCVELFGFKSADEIVGKNFFDFTLEEDREYVINTVRTATDNKDIRNNIVEARIRLANGKVVKTQTKSSPIKFRGEDCRMVVAHNYALANRHEEELKAKNLLLEKISSTIPDHISIFNLATNELVYHNFYFGEMLGIPYENRPESMFDLFTDDHKSVAAAQYAKLFTLKEDEIFTSTSKYKHRDGGIKYLLSRITHFSFNADGTVKEVLSSTIDITEAKEAELKTQRSERLYKTIAENLPNGSVVAFDTDLRFTMAEGPLLAKQGFDTSGILGKTAYDSKPNEHGWSYMIPYFEQVLQGKSFYLEVPDPRFHYHILLKPLYEGDKIYGGLNITLDVKEIKETQSALSKSEEERKTILMALPDTVFQVDITGRILDFYPGDSFGEELQALNFVGMNVKNYIPAADYNTVLRVLKAAIETGEMQTYEHVYREGGLELYFEFRTLPINDTQAVVIVRDVTSLRKTQNALNHKVLELSDKNMVLERYITSNAELEKFAYIASHDLREPVRSIIGFAQLVQRRNSAHLDAEANEHLENIISSGHRMYSLVHGLLDYSRITSDGRTFKLNKLDDILKKVMADVKTAATEADADIAIGELPEVLCDELQIRQLFQNLISNAIKFRSADRKPLIQVKAEQQNGKLLFIVQDNGIGLDMKYAQQIFQIFNRLHTTDKYQGSGIGLALCKKIIERHNGNIWVESKPNVGTSVYFTLAAVS